MQAIQNIHVQRPSPVRLCLAGFAAALAALALCGWAFDKAILTRLVPGIPAMNPVTGVALILASFALAVPTRPQLMLVRILAGLVTAIGAAKLAQLVMGWPVGIDELLFSEVLGVAQGRMVPNGALCLILLGLALATSSSPRRQLLFVSQASATSVLALTLIAVIAYCLDLAAINALDVRNVMALNTALALVALAAATIGINPGFGLMRIIADRGPAGTLARSVIPFALLMPVLIGVARLSGQQAGFYGVDQGVGLQVFANIVFTFAMLGGCTIMLFRNDAIRREREQAVAESEGHYRNAEQVGHIGHWRVELPGEAVQWSDEFYAICGLSRDAIPSLEATLALVHPDDAAVAREVIARGVKQGHDWEVGHRIRRPDGEVRHIKSHGVGDRDARGTLNAIFGVIVDVTELELARREAEAATASKAAFLANMSHEIRTPMNGVMGFVELLMDSDLDVSQRRHLQLIQESANALLKLLNDILDLSKIEAGQLEVNPEPSDVGRDIEQCVRLMTPIAEQKGLKLSAEIDGDFPARVMVDSLRLRQIVFNLLGNAVKFTNRGSVTVRLLAGLDTSRRSIMLIEVKDTGVGIAPERKAAIFEAFVQADVSISRRFGGSGLGLSISRRLARLMDGSIALESVEGEGTLVTLSLPLKPARAPSSPDERRAPRHDLVSGVSAPRTNASILLVEDIDINQELISEMLARLGHGVDFATNGAEALDMARRLAAEPETWDVILMDVQMPVMDGLTATRAIRALGGRAARIPIIALTANAFASEVEACRAAGMNDHVAKPCGFAQLKRVIDRWSGSNSPMAGEGLPAVARPSLIERFEMRRHSSCERLAELIGELGDADTITAKAVLREAERIAHVLAGSAGMFGQSRLGQVAREVEAEIKAMSHEAANSAANPVLNRLIAALDAPAQPADPRVGARA